MANRKGKVSFDRAARKEAIANVMNSNPDMSYAAILPLIVKAADLRESFAADAALRRAGDYYKWLVKSGYAKGTLPTRGAGKTATPKVAKAKAAKIVKPKKVKVTRAMQKAVAAKVEKTDAEIAAIKAKNLETMKKVSKNITKFEDRLSKEVEELNKQSDDFEKLDPREFVPSFLLKEKYVE
jgi:hypothetical protein